MPNCVIDFEFRQPAEKHMGLVSCSLQVEGYEPQTYWLWDKTVEMAELRTRLIELKDHTMIGYVIHLAEARCFHALGLDAREWKWRDLALEWKWLSLIHI